MKYLTIIPDYTSSCIKEDFVGYVDVGDLELPKSFVDELLGWHESYRKIIPLSEEQRNNHKGDIEKLDEQGIDLSKRLMLLVPGGAKVKYYSEGLMGYLPII